MNDLDLRIYRRFLSVVLQETLLFDGTLRENITYGLCSVSDKTVEAALRDASVDEYVKEMTDGVHTLVGERGVRLSGGQTQRLSTARVLIQIPAS